MPNKPNTAEPAKPRGRWFQFRLRALLIGVGLLSIPCGYVAREANIVRERSACRDRIKGFATFDGFQNQLKRPLPIPKVSWLRRFLGDTGVATIVLNQSDGRDEIQATFPEAKVVVRNILDF